MNELDFSGKTVLVTGAGRNIGRAIALEFAQRGANVVLNGRSNEDEIRGVDDEARSLGAETLVVMGDLIDRAVITRIASESADRFGRIDISISNAARRLHKSFFETTDDDWNYHLNQQLSASWYLAKAVVPGMVDAGWGRIIHITGHDAYFGMFSRVPHSVAKGGLHSLTKSLAEGLGQYGITVNDVNPGFTNTIRDPTTHPEVTAEFSRLAATEIPIRRLVEPSEVAWACVFLCSPRAGAITGSVVSVDGGQYRVG